jgi:crossover junction endodeoxyribonuclease RuvC
MDLRSKKVIGIDPGLQHTGWGIVQWDHPNTLQYVAHGVISTNPKDFISKRLSTIQHGIRSVLNRFHLSVGAIEDVFVDRNPAIAIKLGMAKGVALVTLEEANLSSIHEISPNEIKKNIAGSGHATKDQLSYMVHFLLPTLKENLEKNSLSHHATDALAIAICSTAMGRF